MKKLYRRGFTLIELLVVIAIIGILAGIVLVSLNTARSKARDMRRAADLSQIQLGLEMYYDSYGAYPPQSAVTGGISAVATTCPGTRAVPVACVAAENLQCLVACGYMPALPKDPGSTVYYYITAGGRYVLAATMENATASVLPADLDNAQCNANLGAGACAAAAAVNCEDPVYCAGI